jgi:hypothetical protein
MTSSENFVVTKPNCQGLYGVHLRLCRGPFNHNSTLDRGLESGNAQANYAVQLDVVVPNGLLHRQVRSRHHFFLSAFVALVALGRKS